MAGNGNTFCGRLQAETGTCFWKQEESVHQSLPAGKSRREDLPMLRKLPTSDEAIRREFLRKLVEIQRKQRRRRRGNGDGANGTNSR
jgi:hypothetical protein